MQNLLLQPSTIPAAMAVLMLASVVARVRAKPWQRPKPRVDGYEGPEPAAGQTFAIAICVVAVLVGLLAMMIDARWFGRDEYGLVVVPTFCLVLGCGIVAITSLRTGKPGKSAFLAAVEIVALAIAFAMMACSGCLLAGAAAGVG